MGGWEGGRRERQVGVGGGKDRGRVQESEIKEVGRLEGREEGE